jgi:CubicO group peptidase (beta-lactamase class C family)
MERMQRRFLSCALGIVLSLNAASLPEAKPEDVGLSTQRLARIHSMVAKHIDLGDITGAVMLVARKGQIAYVDVQGVMDLESKKPVTRDTVFRIASMTKPVIGTAIMMLLEEGKLRVDDPVSKFIPEFKNMKVAVEAEPGGAAAKPPKFYTVPASREITIKDLLTHTSGLASGPMGASEVVKNPRKAEDTLADYVPRLAATPLEFQPGSRWLYSPGAAFDTLGRIVEIASAIPLDKFLAQRVFGPLEMKDTSFYPTEAQMPRVITAYTKGEKGLTKNPRQITMSSKVYFSGGGGLVSTADDYARFAQMLANGGELAGQRLLSPRTVKLMGSAHVQSTLPGRRTGEGYGLSMRVVQDAVAGNHRVSDGAFGWSGAYGTHFWVDQKEGLIAVMMIQTPIGEMRPEFENAVMQAIVQ